MTFKGPFQLERFYVQHICCSNSVVLFLVFRSWAISRRICRSWANRRAADFTSRTGIPSFLLQTTEQYTKIHLYIYIYIFIIYLIWGILHIGVIDCSLMLRTWDVKVMLIFSLYGYGLVLLCLYCAIPEAKSCFWGNLNSRYVLQLGSEIMLYSLKVLDTCVPASQHRFEVQNSFQSPLHRMTWVGRDLNDHLVQRMSKVLIFFFCYRYRLACFFLILKGLGAMHMGICWSKILFSFLDTLWWRLLPITNTSSHWEHIPLLFLATSPSACPRYKPFQ